jgi:hypothetical protein
MGKARSKTAVFASAPATKKKPDSVCRPAFLKCQQPNKN